MMRLIDRLKQHAHDLIQPSGADALALSRDLEHAALDLEDYAARINVLPVKPGDIVVFEFPGAISVETADRIKAAMEERFPDLRAIVIGDGGRVQVLSVNPLNEVAFSPAPRGQ